MPANTLPETVGNRGRCAGSAALSILKSARWIEIVTFSRASCAARPDNWLVLIRKPRMQHWQFPVRKGGIFCHGKKIKGLRVFLRRRSVLKYAAQETPKIDTAMAAKAPFRTETSYPGHPWIINGGQQDRILRPQQVPDILQEARLPPFRWPLVYNRFERSKVSQASGSAGGI